MATDTELAWAAGIVDGEGCLSIGGGPKRPRTIRVSVFNTDPRMVLECQRIFGGFVKCKHTGGITEKGNRRKACFVWYVGGRKAIPVLEAIYPFLIIKKEQADLLFAFHKTTAGYGYDLRAGEKELCSSLRLVLSELHHKEFPVGAIN